VLYGGTPGHQPPATSRSALLKKTAHGSFNVRALRFASACSEMEMQRKNRPSTTGFGFLQGVLTQEAHEAIQARELDSVEHLLMAGFQSGRCRLDQR
jgi:hypothetical protein